MKFWFYPFGDFEKEHPSIWKVLQPTSRDIKVPSECESGKIYQDYLVNERIDYEIFRRQHEVQENTPCAASAYWFNRVSSEEIEAIEEQPSETERRISPYVPSVRKIPVLWRIRCLFDAGYQRALARDWCHQFLWQEQLAKDEQQRLAAEQKRLRDEEWKEKSAVMRERIELLKEAIRDKTPVYYLNI